MTSRCGWFTQPASATRTNRSGSMVSRVPEAGSVGCLGPGGSESPQAPSKQPLGCGVDSVLGQYEMTVSARTTNRGEVQGQFTARTHIPKTLYMVIEHFKCGDPVPVYRRF